MKALYSLLPAMDQVLARVLKEPELAGAPRALVHQASQAFLDGVREEIRAKVLTSPDDLAENRLLPRLICFARAFVRPRLRRVLNATGVVVHTNLGRAVLAEQAAQAAAEAGRWYSNLEFDLSTGKRGSRHDLVEGLLRTLTGAEAALVVNNNAAAVLLVLDSLAKGREVIVSRGQLVEIGGSFRIPEVMAKSGAVLREVGATNRTHLRDYAAAIGDQTAALLKVHTSNFRITGFTSEVPLADMAALARERGLAVIEDLGSGTLLDFSQAGLPGEPTVQACVAQGADLVTFSGDKALGGPQAGIIVGRAELVAKLKSNPLLRALRPGKLALAALEATLRLYLDPDTAKSQVPTLAMITAGPDALKAKARRLGARIRKNLGETLVVDIVPGVSRVGGGAFPEQDLPTTLVAVTCRDPAASPDRLRQALLKAKPPLVGRVERERFCLDPRTLSDDELNLAVRALAQAVMYISS